MNASLERLLSISEFAAATQLTPKALRLYDEQGLLRPASIDPANGYRYYASTQVGRGRLIRTLRDMSLSLSDIARVLEASPEQGDALLVQLSQEIDRRHASEKRAFQAALLLLRKSPRSSALLVEEAELAPMTASVHPFSASRERVIEAWQAAVTDARVELANAGLEAGDCAYCVFVDPLSDEDGRLEALLLVDAAGAAPRGLTVRRLGGARCALVRGRPVDPVSALDALFDWFDRRGCSAVGAPMMRVGRDLAQIEFLWAFDAFEGGSQ